jgi:SAM-dependent methyltransferase
MTSGQQPATSFGAAVAAYELGRPGYAAEHVEWMLDGVRGRILDLAAGSGKLTRSVAQLGHEVVAVDPDEKMLARNLGVETLVGTAERIPLADRSVGAVTVGQAWHWFDPVAAGAEIARVLTPGGRLALVWNIRDARHPFVAALSEAMGVSPAEAMIDADRVHEVPGFSEFERRRFESVPMISAEAIEALVTSRSPWLVASPATQAKVLAAVRELVSTHPHSAGRRVFEFPMFTACYRADALT